MPLPGCCTGAQLVMAAKGGLVSEVTVGDVVELLDAQAAVNGKSGDGSTLFYKVLRETGVSAPVRRRRSAISAPSARARPSR